MRTGRVAFFSGVAGVTGALVACANTVSSSRDPFVEPDAGDASVVFVDPPSSGDAAFDGGSGEAGPTDAALECSEAGWCETRTPAGSLTFFDLAVRDETAFALAWLDGLTTLVFYDGAKWNVVSHEKWAVAPKGKQMLRALAATSDDEVWVGGEGGLLMRGRRDGTGTFTWSTHDLGTRDAVRSIYAAGASDLFVAAGTRVYRRGGPPPLAGDDGGLADAGVDGGTDWYVDFEEADDPSSITLDHVVGAGAGDVWLTGMRARLDFPYTLRCGYVVHRSANGWSHVVDSIIDEFGTCSPRDTYLFSQWAFARAEASGQQQLTMLRPDTSTLLRLALGANGEPTLEEISVASDTQATWTVPSSGEMFAVGFGMVRRNPQPWSGGQWQVSSVALDGKPTLKWFRAVGGTRLENVWVVGESNALHKTTP